MEDLKVYLNPTDTIDSESETIARTAAQLTAGCSTDSEKTVKLFYFVRDSIPYNVYMISMFREDFVASTVLEREKGYCVQKAVLLAALGRAAGIPTRLAFASIRNHRVPARFVEKLGTNVFPRHGYDGMAITSSFSMGGGLVWRRRLTGLCARRMVSGQSSSTV